MTIPVIGHVPDDWEYNPDESDDESRQYDCTPAEFGTMTYTKIREEGDEFYVIGSIDSRNKIDESFDNAKDANRRAIDFMEDNPY